jgi:hypothetical protein
VVDVGVGDGDGDDAGDTFGTEGVFEWWCVEDVTVALRITTD